MCPHSYGLHPIYQTSAGSQCQTKDLSGELPDRKSQTQTTETQFYKFRRSTSAGGEM
jgi:hypothetical protein